MRERAMRRGSLRSGGMIGFGLHWPPDRFRSQRAVAGWVESLVVQRQFSDTTRRADFMC